MRRYHICCRGKRHDQTFENNSTAGVELQLYCPDCGSKFHTAEQCNSAIAHQIREEATCKLVHHDIQPPTPSTTPPSTTAASSSTAAKARAPRGKVLSLLQGLDISLIVEGAEHDGR